MTGRVMWLPVAAAVAAALIVALLAAAAGPAPDGREIPCLTAAPPRAVACVFPAARSPR